MSIRLLTVALPVVVGCSSSTTLSDPGVTHASAGGAGGSSVATTTGGASGATGGAGAGGASSVATTTGGAAGTTGGAGAGGASPVVTANGAIVLGPPGYLALATQDDVFWVTDTKILHARRDGTSLTTVATVKPYLLGLALGGDTLFWAELADPPQASSIKAVSTTGGEPVVVADGLGAALDLLVHDGTLYFMTLPSLPSIGTATLQSLTVAGTTATGSVQTIATFADTLGAGFTGSPGDWLVTTASSATSGTLLRLVGDAPPEAITTLPYAFGATRGTDAVFLTVGATFGTDTINHDGALLRVALKGGMPVTLQSGLAGINGTQLFGTDVYWYRPQCPECSGGEILRAPQAGGPAEVVLGSLPNPSALVVDAWGMVWSSDAMYAGPIPSSP